MNGAPSFVHGRGLTLLMPLRFHDQFPSFREVDGLSDTAFRLHVTAFFWCYINRTDGLISKEDLVLVCARVRASERFAAECVRRDAWHDARHDCGSEFCGAPFDEDGWAVHDFLKENASRKELEASESAKSQGAKRGNHVKWHESRGIRSPACEFCFPPPPNLAKRASVKRSHSDRISDRRATPISRSDDDHLNHHHQNSHASDQVAYARGDDPRITHAVIATVIASVQARDGRIITERAAALAAARGLARADRKRRHIHDPARWLATLIDNEPDLYAELIDEPPPMPDILRDFAGARDPDGQHEFVPGPVPDVCDDCGLPRWNQGKHREAS